MLRAIIYLLITIFLVTFLRMVVGLILNTMKGMMNPAAETTAGGAQVPHPTVSGELKRDPVCGTFVPANTSFQKTIRGNSYHFCSAECRDKHEA